MTGFLHRLVQRGLGRARTVQPLHPASFARDAARAAVRPAALPVNIGGARHSAAKVFRQADASEDPEEKKSEEISREAVARTQQAEKEEDAVSPVRAKLSRASEGASATKPGDDEEAPLVQTQAFPVQSRRLRPSIFRESDNNDADDAEDAGGDFHNDADAGDSTASGDFGEGLAADAGTQADVPEDEDQAPGKGNDILSPKLYRSVSRHRRSASRIYRASEGNERDDESRVASAHSLEDDATRPDEDQVSAARIQRRAAGPGPTALSAPRVSGEGLRRGVGAGEFLMPPTSAVGARNSADFLTSGDANLNWNSDPAGAESHPTHSDPRGAAALQSGASDSQRRDFRQEFGRSNSGESRRPPAAVPEIQISIGRIEIRAVNAAPTAQPTGSGERTGGAGKMQSLQDYLKRRNGEIL